ncbi:MAG: polysaccharide deacetylase family protein [Hyphomicrobium sp.]
MTAGDKAPEQDAGKGASPSAVPVCASESGKLGLSRVVEIDASGGPEFGGKDGRRHDFLTDHEVVLTFDDGPMRAYTRRVLAALAAQCTRATFFMVGRMAAADPTMVREVMAEGHTVAAHTWSHKNLRELGTKAAEQDFELGISAINRAAKGTAAPFFRFPYLSENSAILERAADRGIATFWIDVDSKDYLTRNSKEVHRRIMAQLNAKGKGIILMHDIQPSTVGALPGLLEELRKRGYKVVHVTPKTSLTTVSTYDAAVAKAFASKLKALRDNPIADRSVVWSADPAANGDKPSGAAPADEELPWQQPASTADASSKPVARKKKSPPTAIDPPWQLQPFGY